MDFKYTRQELDLLKHKLFDSKSEKVSERQLLTSTGYFRRTKGIAGGFERVNLIPAKWIKKVIIRPFCVKKE